ncbi:MAG: hypothetical protein FLDDKLPJ_02860 [Phycisphaerae bacterium]|nr:hypothetical protein [Phycisphaerae bacterium]
MRVYALYVFTLILMGASMRDWFIGACGLLLTSLILEHPDYPNSMMGVSGVNPWNILFIWVVVLWMTQRPHEPSGPPMSRAARFLVGGYVISLTVAVAMGVAGAWGGSGKGMTVGSLVMDYFLNPMKIIVLGYLIFDGAKTPGRQVATMMCVVASALVTSTLALKYRLATGLSGDFMRGRQRLGNEVGLHANQMAWVLAGTFWGLLAMAGLWKRRSMRWATAAAAALPGLATLVVQSRAGYLALGATGLMMGVVRWRKLLILLPAGAIGVLLVVPSVADRIMMGVDRASSPMGQTQYDLEVITAGRTDVLWPPVIDVILQSPLIGHGRVSILRTSARSRIEAAIGVCPTHPHNAVLEVLSDSGLLGGGLIFAFYAGFVLVSVRLFRQRHSPLATAVGGLALALVTARLVTGVSGHSYYPIRSMFGLFALGGLALRVATNAAAARFRAATAAGSAPAGFLSLAPPRPA